MRTILTACLLLSAACAASETSPPQTPPPSVSASVTGADMAAPSVDVTTAAPAPMAGSNTLVPSPTPSRAMVGRGATSASTTTTVPPAMGGTVDTASLHTSGSFGGDGQGAGATAPDNTKVNARDGKGALTAMSQGNSADEVRITAAIRRGMMSDSSLSMTAKNVKVITIGTKVTLRGPVNSPAERTAIEARARQTAGVTDVDDQLEVK